MSWRWIFYVNVPIVVVALVMAARLLKADAGRADAGRLDWLGLALLSPGLAGIVFGLSESESHGGFGDPLVWVPIAGGLVLVALFVRHAWGAPRPLIDVRLFRDRAFSAAGATTFLVGAALFGAMIILPLYYQVARGESALTAGLLMAPQGFGAALAMPIAGRLTDKLGGGRVAVVGLLILTLGSIPFAFLGPDTSYTLLALLLVLRGLGIGSSMMPAMAAAYATLDSAAVPRATSALNVMQRIGGSLGTALLAVVLQGEISDRLPRAAGGGGATLERLPDAVRAQGGGAAGGGVRRDVLVGGGDVGGRTHPRHRARGDAEARARRGPARRRGGARAAAGVTRAVFSRDWQPEGTPRGAVALVHGLGEHSGRYEPARGALHRRGLRGLGDRPARPRAEPGRARRHALRARARGHRRAGRALRGERGGGAGLRLRPFARRDADRAVAARAPGRAGGGRGRLGDRAAQRAARAGGQGARGTRARPGAAEGARQVGHRPGDALARSRGRRRPTARTSSCTTSSRSASGSTRSTAIDAIQAGAPQLAVPLLVIHGGEDALAYASGARELAALAPAVCTLQVYDGLFHEIHNEPEQERVFADVLAWIEARLPESTAR